MYDLNRFLEAQEDIYDNSLSELQSGKKLTYGCWFVFQQIRGLGFTQNNVFYGIKNLHEAQQYYDHPF